MLGHKTSFNKFLKIEIILSIFSNHNGMKLEIKLREKHKNVWRLNIMLQSHPSTYQLQNLSNPVLIALSWEKNVSAFDSEALLHLHRSHCTCQSSYESRHFCKRKCFIIRYSSWVPEQINDEYQDNTVLNNEWVSNEFKDEIHRYLETKENENAVTLNLWDMAKAILKGKFIALQAYFK